jgi:cytochrome c oxidase assembly protein Cox11
MKKTNTVLSKKKILAVVSLVVVVIVVAMAFVPLYQRVTETCARNNIRQSLINGNSRESVDKEIDTLQAKNSMVDCDIHNTTVSLYIF